MTDAVVATKPSWSDRVVSFVFGLSVVAWMFYVPADPERLMSYIPDGAQAVVRIHEPVEGLAALSEHPFIVRAEKEGVADVGPLRDFLKDASTVQWLERVLGDDVVFAHEPQTYQTGGRPEGWMIGAWVGGYGTAASWALTFSSEVRMEPEPFGAGHVLYHLEKRPQGYDVAMTVYYGLLLAYVSKQDASGGLKRMLARADFAPNRSSIVDHCPEGPGGDIEFWLDRARYQRFGRRYNPDYLAGSLRVGSEGGLELVGTVHWGLNGMVTFSGESEPVKALSGILGDRLDAVYLGGQRSIGRIFDGASGPTWAQIVVNQIHSLVGEDRPAFVGMMSGDDLNGRIGLMSPGTGERRLRELAVPTFLAGVYVGDEAETEMVLNRALDLLNARYSLGVIPRQEAMSGHLVTVLDPTTDNGYARQHPDYRVALVEKNGWLLVSAHVKPLAALLSTPVTEEAGWLKGLGAEERSASVWIRTQDVKPYRDILACMRMLGVGRMSAKNHSMIKGWLNSLETYTAIRMDVTGGDKMDRITLVIE